MIKIETKRLRLIPLDKFEIENLLHDELIFCKEHHLSEQKLELNAPSSFLAELQDALQSWCIPQMLTQPDAAIWFTHWMIIKKDSNTRIGGFGFAGPPDQDQEIEIGYFIDRRWEGKGIMTEALEGIINWLAQNQYAKSLRAYTLITPNGSQRVLEKCGFALSETMEEVQLWRKPI